MECVAARARSLGSLAGSNAEATCRGDPMRRLLCILILVATAAHAGGPAHASDGQTYTVRSVASDDVLNMRSGPSAYAPIVGTIPPDGRSIRLVGGCVGVWCRVVYGGTAGWVNRQFLKPHKSVVGWMTPPPIACFRIVNVAPNEALKVRAEPSNGAKVIGTIAPDSACVKLEGKCWGAWCRASLPDVQGWVHSKFLAPAD